MAWFRASTIASDALHEAQQQRGEKKCLHLIQEVSTRWNSLYFMLKRLHQEYNAVVVAVRATDSAHRGQLWTPLEETAVGQLIRILAYFEYASRRSESEKDVTISRLATFVYTLRNKILVVGAEDPAYLIEVSSFY